MEKCLIILKKLRTDLIALKNAIYLNENEAILLIIEDLDRTITFLKKNCIEKFGVNIFRLIGQVEEFIKAKDFYSKESYEKIEIIIIESDIYL